VEVSAQGQETYWLIYNGTISIFTLCSPLIAFGYAQLAVEYPPTSVCTYIYIYIYIYTFRGWSLADGGEQGSMGRVDGWGLQVYLAHKKLQLP